MLISACDILLKCRWRVRSAIRPMRLFVRYVACCRGADRLQTAERGGVRQCWLQFRIAPLGLGTTSAFLCWTPPVYAAQACVLWTTVFSGYGVAKPNIRVSAVRLYVQMICVLNRKLIPQNNASAKLLHATKVTHMYASDVCKPIRPTQPPTFSGKGNKYRPKGRWSSVAGSKYRYGSFHLWINVRGRGR